MQEVIVYRNPAGAVIWDMIMSNGHILFPFICGFAAFIFAMTLLNMYVTRPVLVKYRRKTNRPWYVRKMDTIVLTLSTIVGMIVFWWLKI